VFASGASFIVVVSWFQDHMIAKKLDCSNIKEGEEGVSKSREHDYVPHSGHTVDENCPSIQHCGQCAMP
jgi:hypothetical protein